MSKSKWSKKRCIYCGKKAHGKDHVPPKAIFGSVKGHNLITVPSCTPCNSSFAKDDEYFRMVLCMEDGAGKHPDAWRAWNKTFKAFSENRNPGLARVLAESISEVDIKTPGGIWLGKRPTMNVDVQRLARVASRIVLGLSYRSSGFPDGVRPDAYARLLFTPESYAEKDFSAMRKVLDAVLTAKKRSIGDNTFQYWKKDAIDNGSTSAWLLCFYESVYFLGAVTVAPGQRSAMRQLAGITT